MITQKIYATDIENRIDPYYYQPEFVEIKRKLGKLKLKKIKDISTNLKNGSTPKGGVFEKSGIPYFRSQDFNLFDFETRQFITSEFHKRLSRSTIQANDILVAVVGATLGVVGYVPEDIQEGNINQNVARIRVNDSKINPKYLAIFLASKIGQKLIFRNATITTQSYLNNQQLGEIEIPILEKQTQDGIIKLITTAHQIRKEKLKQADELLNSIDGYVRQQLGIAYTEPEKKKAYSVSADELQNRRHDPYYYKPDFIKLEKTLLNSKAVRLGTLLNSITNGLDYRKFSEDGTLDYLRVSNIKPYKIDYTEVKRVRLNQSDISKNIFGKRDDVLLTRKGTYGSSVSLEQDLNALISSEVFLLKVNTEKVNPHYLSIFLNSSLGQKQFLRNKVGAIMGSLSQEAVKDTYVVIPSGGKQLDIAKEVEERLRKVRELRQQTKQTIEDAKKKVEEMILN